MPSTASSGYKLFDEFVPEILQYCHGAPTILARTHIRNATIDFLERSMILKKDPASFCLDADEHTYTLKYSSDRYRAISIVGKPRLGETSTNKYIDVVTEHYMDSCGQGWRLQEAKEPSACFLTEPTNGIRFYPIPNEDSDEDIYLTTAVTLRRGQTEVDEWVWEKYEDTIQAGALSAVLSIPGASWYNQKLADSFHLEYRRGIKRARAIALKGTGDFSGRVQPQSFDVMGSDTIPKGE